MTVFVSRSMHAWVKACCAWGEESVLLVQRLVCCVCYVYSVVSIYIHVFLHRFNKRAKNKESEERKRREVQHKTRRKEAC